MTGKRNLVSLCPSITETLIDFGLADQLVGITRYCIHPAQVVAEIPKVGGTKNPDLDAIRRAQPELIFVNEEENRREDYDALARDFEIDVSMPKTIAEIPAQLRRLGALLDRSEVAEQRAVELEQALAELDRPRKTFRFAYLIWKKPWMTVGPDTYVSDLLTRGGGQNVFLEGRYPETSLEEIAAHRPDLVLLPDEPYPFDEGHEREVQAAVDGRVLRVCGDDYCWHGVRSIRGARAVAALPTT